MEAEVADELPPPPGWSYEPKWDGFRAIAWSVSNRADGPRLDSRNAKPLLRYFPELEPALRALPPGTVTDGEVVVLRAGRLDFDALQNRIHPAESRVALLSAQTPAHVALFDLLAVRGEDLRGRPLGERRALLVALAAELAAGSDGSPWLLSPSTTNIETARVWFTTSEAAGFDGIVAKALDQPYAPGRREMIKVKHRRTVDCVVGGYRVRKDGQGVASLLLGLYNPEGEGFGEHARRPGGQSRWSGDKDLDYVAVRPLLVVEISYDQLTGDRFRHATRFERWRPDKDPRDCTLDQLERPQGPTLQQVLAFDETAD
jgi:ATP-dependent DNA ligase